ncbi:MAG: family 43 glycosylhydrolase, partial [Anaerolineae bacterium]|nr:family 43 glycosylhydrolase [Anaerolineae bacterium]
MLSKFTPGAIWPDTRGTHINAHGGGMLHHGGVYYWFGEHKVEGRRGNKALVGVHCYASDDLYNWEDMGIALAVSDDPTSDITRGCVLERPKVIHNAETGKFVMWFHLELKGQGYKAARSGVAVSDSVMGPYTFLQSFRPNAGVWPLNATEEQKEALDPESIRREFRGEYTEDIDQVNILGRDFAGGQMARDMTLFVDDDGQAYHLYASEENSTLQISRLTEDYLAPAGEYVRAFPKRYMEAPAICRRHGKYYFIGSDCTGWAPNAARS